MYPPPLEREQLAGNVARARNHENDLAETCVLKKPENPLRPPLVKLGKWIVEEEERREVSRRA